MLQITAQVKRPPPSRAITKRPSNGPPIVGSLDDLEREPALPERRDHQPAPHVRGIRLGMARRAERYQPVEVEVRAPLGALDDVRYRAGSLELSPKLIMYQWLVAAWTTIRNLFCSFRFFTSRPPEATR